MSSEKRLRTYMSQVFFKSPTAKDPVPLKAQRGTDSEETDIYLLDELLGGGIVIPDDVVEARLGNSDKHPTYATCPGLLMLVTGAPGSGKSTFALELCYRLSLSYNDNSALHKCFNKGISSLYVSAEASARSLIQNAVSYGWKEDVHFVYSHQIQSRLSSQIIKCSSSEET
ncbi:MAG: hypothetical protein KKD92_15885 [Proteobacteria bacterium]|nr:hypothetical protein [Pseudomonadota bacterium]